jgi:hypothetical protein
VTRKKSAYIPRLCTPDTEEPDEGSIAVFKQTGSKQGESLANQNERVREIDEKSLPQEAHAGVGKDLIIPALDQLTSLSPDPNSETSTDYGAKHRPIYSRV